MRKDLTFDQRELDEIHHSLYYMKVLHHGTAGHGLFMLIGKMADAIGFELDRDGDLYLHADPNSRDMFVPEGSVRIIQEIKNESS